MSSRRQTLRHFLVVLATRSLDHFNTEKYAALQIMVRNALHRVEVAHALQDHAKQLADLLLVMFTG
jgi:hypothetical protein